MPTLPYQEENFLNKQVMGATYESLLFAALGGLLIALSSSLHLYVKGRITGMSGILNGLITMEKSSLYWKLSLVLGLQFVASVFYLFVNESHQFFENAYQFNKGTSIYGFVLAGFLVGFGTKFGNGCTSGHGVCGIPRFSLRSIVSTGIYFTVAIITANLFYVFNDEFSFFTKSNSMKQFAPDANGQPSQAFAYTFLALSIIGFIAMTLHKRFTSDTEVQGKYYAIDCIVSFTVGVLFGMGLIIGGMAQRHVILGVLTFNSHWNPTLLVLFMFAVIPNIFTFAQILKRQAPLLATEFTIPKLKEIDSNLVIGATLFGIGWGIAGICPGPTFVLLPQFLVELVIFFFIPQCIGNGLATIAQRQK